MQFIARHRASGAPPSGGGIGPLVSFDGANDFISNIAGMGESTEFTFAFRLVLDGDPAALDTLVSFFFGAMRFSNAVGLRQIQMELLAQNFTEVVNAEDGITWSDNDVLACVLAGDTDAGLAGGKSISCYINGSEVISSTTSTGNFWKFDDAGANELEIFSDNGGRWTQAECNGLWVSDTAVDPQSHYSSFFDGSHEFQASIPTDGVINGVTPRMWQNGNVAAWNSDQDNNGNSYTMNGAVT